MLLPEQSRQASGQSYDLVSLWCILSVTCMYLRGLALWLATGLYQVTSACYCLPQPPQFMTSRPVLILCRQWCMLSRECPVHVDSYSALVLQPCICQQCQQAGARFCRYTARQKASSWRVCQPGYIYLLCGWWIAIRHG